MAIFDPRYKLPLHIVQLVLIHVAIGLSAPALFMNNQPRTRASTIALAMGAKSIFFIGYQILTEHFGPFRRWASLKANAIINSLEIIFWAAVVFLIVQANINSCIGIGCGLRWGVMATSIILTGLSTYAAAISVLEFRKSKRDIGDLEKSASDPGRSLDGEGVLLGSVAKRERALLGSQEYRASVKPNDG